MVLEDRLLRSVRVANAGNPAIPVGDGHVGADEPDVADLERVGRVSHEGRVLVLKEPLDLVLVCSRLRFHESTSGLWALASRAMPIGCRCRIRSEPSSKQWLRPSSCA